jgi:ABC-type nitrate/sulfonate/bicarbonate transport system substrate-binding protein
MTGTRRARVLTACIALAAIFGAAGCSSGSSTGSASTGSSTSGGRVMTIGLQSPNSAVPAYVALKLGLFAKAGISGIQLKVFTSLPALFAAVQHNQLDLAYQTIPGVVHFDSATQSGEILLLGAGPDNDFSWVAAKGSGVSDTAGSWQAAVRSWKGKTVGVTALGGIIDLFTRYIASQVGLVPGKNFTIDPIGAGPAAAAALGNGVVSIAAGEQTTARRLVATGGTTILNLAQGIGPSALANPSLLTGAFSIASQAAITSNKAFYTDFQTAYNKAKQEMPDPANKSIVISAVMQALGISNAQATSLYPEVIGDKQQLTPTSYAATVAVFKQTGILTGTIPTYAQITAGLP